MIQRDGDAAPEYAEKKRNLLDSVVGLIAWVRLLPGTPLWKHEDDEMKLFKKFSIEIFESLKRVSNVGGSEENEVRVMSIPNLKVISY